MEKLQPGNKIGIVHIDATEKNVRATYSICGIVVAPSFKGPFSF